MGDTVENDRAKMLWDFRSQTEKQVMANKPYIVVVDILQKKGVVIGVEILLGSNIKKKEHKELEK